MNRKAFHLLLKKYLDNRCSEQERELVDQWYDLMDEERLLTKEAGNLSDVEERIWQKIQDTITVRPRMIQKKTFSAAAIRVSYKWAAAAMIIIVAGIGVFTANYKHTALASLSIADLPQRDHFYVKKNNTNAVMMLMLADKSIVQLQPGAVISYPKQFADDKREVYLEGTAFFKVTKNPLSPFTVYTGTIITQVLGTSFTVKKIDNRFEVAVLTGKVAVYEKGNSQLHNKGGVVITPNERVTYYSNDHHFITSLVDNPVIVNKEEDVLLIKEPFSFDETPVLDIIRKIEETYAVQIITENEQINHCLFSGNISGQSLYNMLDIICQAIGADYEIRGTSIILTGNGCE